MVYTDGEHTWATHMEAVKLLPRVNMKTSCLLLLFAALTGAVSGYDWEYFTFAQAWPPATCAKGVPEHHTCMIPATVKDWTVHGLWPSRPDSKGPDSCNTSWPFDVHKVATIVADMKAHWPNLYIDTAPNYFWTHEWSAHGTCCTDLPATSNELNFFTQGLQMNRKFDIGSILSKSGIVPTLANTYSYNDFISAVTKATGYSPVIDCAVMKLKNGTNMHLIAQVEICLDKTFTPRSCYNSQPAAPPSLTFNRAAMDMTHSSLYYKSSGSFQYKPQSNCPTHYDFYYPPIDTHFHDLV